MLKGIGLAFKDIGKSLTKTLKEDLNDSGSKTGRLYRVRVGNRIILHKSSGPGQTPDTMTGKYEKNIRIEVSGGNQMKFGIDSAVKYSGFLEEGTSKMVERPGLGNTVKKEERNARKYFELRTMECLTK